MAQECRFIIIEFENFDEHNKDKRRKICPKGHENQLKNV
jgi:hypothetical protein